MSVKRPVKVTVALTSQELEILMKAFNATGYRSRSAYVRKLLLKKPAKVNYRNRSLDDFIEIAVKLRKELKLLLEKEAFSEMEKNTLSNIMASIEVNLIQIVNTCKPRSG